MARGQKGGHRERGTAAWRSKDSFAAYVMALMHEDVEVKPGSCVKKPVFAARAETSITMLPIACAGCSTGRSAVWAPSASSQLSVTLITFFGRGGSASAPPSAPSSARPLLPVPFRTTAGDGTLTSDGSLGLRVRGRASSGAFAAGAASTPVEATEQPLTKSTKAWIDGTSG